MCIERFTGKFQMEVIIPMPLEWGLWSEQGTCCHANIPSEDYEEIRCL